MSWWFNFEVIRNIILTGLHARGRFARRLESVEFCSDASRKAEMSLEQISRRIFPAVHEILRPSHAHVPMPQLGRLVSHELPAGEGYLRTAHARDFWNFAARKKLRTFLLSTVHAAFSNPMRRHRLRYISGKHYTMSGTSGKKSRNPSRNNLKPNETLFIGDMDHDIETRGTAASSCPF